MRGTAGPRWRFPESFATYSGRSVVTVYIDPIIIACIDQLDAILPAGDWAATNERQTSLLESRDCLRTALQHLPDGVVQAIGSRDVATVNEFLRERGHTIQLNDAGPLACYAAAVLDLIVKWREPGAEKPLRLRDGATVPGVEMRRDQFMALGPVLMLGTESDVDVWIVESRDLDEGLAAMRAVPLHRGGAGDHDYKSAVFPMIDYSGAVDVGWLTGMAKHDAVVTQAIAQASLKLDHVGAHAKAAMAMAVTRSIAKHFTIAGPCTVAFVTGGGDVVIAFHVGREHFRKP